MQEMQERPCGATAKPLCKAASAPSYRSYTSYWSYRGVLWHVADVPGVQGKGRRSPPQRTVNREQNARQARDGWGERHAASAAPS